jgi:hypothetical protein
MRKLKVKIIYRNIQHSVLRNLNKSRRNAFPQSVSRIRNDGPKRNEGISEEQGITGKITVINRKYGKNA